MGRDMIMEKFYCQKTTDKKGEQIGQFLKDGGDLCIEVGDEMLLPVDHKDRNQDLHTVFSTNYLI